MKSNIQSHVRCCFLLTLLLGYETLKYRRKILLHSFLLHSSTTLTRRTTRAREREHKNRRTRKTILMSSYFGSAIGSLFQSGPKLAHDIVGGEIISSSRTLFGSHWKTFEGKSQETGEVVTVFTCKIKDKEKERVTLELARNGAKRLKLCKHPNVLQVKETLEIESGNEITIHVVTVCLFVFRERRSITSSSFDFCSLFFDHPNIVLLRKKGFRKSIVGRTRFPRSMWYELSAHPAS